MSFILSWSGYFSRKGWDPKLWAKAKNANSYDKCAKLIGKMCVTPPTEEEYREHFWDESFDASPEPVVPEASTKELKPEQPKEAKADPPKRKTRSTRSSSSPKKATPKTRSTRPRSKSSRTSKTKDAS